MNRFLTVAVKKDGFEVSAFGEKWFECPVSTGIDANGERDRDDPFLNVLSLREENISGGVRYVWSTVSNLWARKEYVLEAADNAARFYVRVEGSGKIDRVRFFEGRAGYEAAGYLLPLANHADYFRNLRMMTEPGRIGLGYFAPPCYVYPFYMAGAPGWMGVGLAARAGQYNFDEFLYVNDNKNGCGFETPLYGQTAAEGSWESQSLLFVAGENAYDAVRRYAQWHYDNGWCRRKDRTQTPSWWKKPIFCGWGEQAALQKRHGGQCVDYATQKDYSWMSEKLDEYGLHPGVIMIDDKWQKEYGSATPDPEKWPDLRAFADAEHAKGRKVILWFRSWYPEGLSAQECVEWLCTACAADPTSEVYRARMKKTIRLLLSDEDGACNCDGFKIDFANCMPLGQYVSCCEKGVFGVELLKRFFVMMRDYAKEAKPDALINCSCAHPYFDEVVDQIRIHDYYGTMRNAPEVMGHRARLAAAALPDVLIDTDAGGTGSKRDFFRWIKAQPELGIPDLYYLTASRDVPFDDECIARIREEWRKYEEKLAGGEN